MHRDVHQARECRAGEHLRYARQRDRIQHALPNHSEGTQALGDERAPIGQKRQAPGVGQPRRHDAHADALTLGCPILDRRVRKGDGGDALGRKGLRVALLRVEKMRRLHHEQCGAGKPDDGSIHLCLPDEWHGGLETGQA